MLKLAFLKRRMKFQYLEPGGHTIESKIPDPEDHSVVLSWMSSSCLLSRSQQKWCSSGH